MKGGDKKGLRRAILTALVVGMLLLNVVIFYNTYRLVDMRFIAISVLMLVVVAIYLYQLFLIRNLEGQVFDRELTIMGLQDAQRAEKEAATARERQEQLKAQELEEIDHQVHMMQMQLTAEEPLALAKQYFQEVAYQCELVQGMLFTRREDGMFEMKASYALYTEHGFPEPFALGDTLTGQVIRERKSLYLSSLPEDYVIIASGLGKSVPKHIYIIPLNVSGDRESYYGAVELAFFRDLTSSDLRLIERFTSRFADRITKMDNVTNEEQSHA